MAYTIGELWYNFAYTNNIFKMKRITNYKIFFFFLLLIFPTIGINAQDDNNFSPDCPGATTGPDIMPQWSIDWETGFSHEWNRKNGAHERTWVINTSTFRMGVSPNAEVRLQIDESATRTSTNNYIGISTLAIGTKIKITDSKGSIPKISFLGTLLIPGSSHSNYLPQHIGIQTHLLFESELNEYFSLGYDIGTEWDGETNNPNIFFGACLNYQATNKLSFFIESYNLYNSQKQEDWAKPGRSSHFNFMSEIGAAYMVTPRFQVNMYGDINFNEPSKYANIGLGMAWLIK